MLFKLFQPFEIRLVGFFLLPQYRVDDVFESRFVHELKQLWIDVGRFEPLIAVEEVFNVVY